MISKFARLFFIALIVLCYVGSARSEEVVFVVNNYGHSIPFQPNDSTVMMLRGSDLEILDTLILWGLRDPHSAALTRDRRHLWVTCPGAGKIAIIDVRSFELIRTIDFGIFYPMGIAITPDGRYAYVTLSRSGNLAKYDTRTYSMVGPLIYLGFADSATSYILFTPDGAKAYIVDTDYARVYVLRTSDDSVIQTRSFGGYALNDAVVSPDGGKVYVCNMDQDQIEVIRTSDDTVLSPIPTTVIKPRGIGISPDGAYLFVGHYDPLSPTSKVTMIRLSDNTTVATANIAQNGRRVAVRPDGSRIFVSEHNYDRCYAFDVSGETLTPLTPMTFTDLNIMEAPDYVLRATPIGLKIGQHPPPFSPAPLFILLLND